tara:strand:+ start:35042 stop:35512 length:471 start_codon:yes stop_codon:yes gene_type:complete
MTAATTLSEAIEKSKASPKMIVYLEYTDRLYDLAMARLTDLKDEEVYDSEETLHGVSFYGPPKHEGLYEWSVYLKRSSPLRYSAEGSVRGNCGHNHRSIDTACACLLRDQRDCASLGGGTYSDRKVVRSDGRPLNYGERERVNSCLYYKEELLGEM